MTSYPIATELSAAVVAARILRGELRTPRLSLRNRKSLPVLSSPVHGMAMLPTDNDEAHPRMDASDEAVAS